MVILWFLLAPAIEKCSEMPGSPTLQTGQRIMYQMAGRKNLRQVGFFETHPSAKPSDFVNMISDPDHVLWPPPPPSRDPITEARTGGNRIYMPEGLVFSPRKRRSTDVDEIVFDADDEQRLLIVKGYSPNKEEPAFVYDWDFPTTAGKINLN
jgi:hypothetical protein